MTNRDIRRLAALDAFAPGERDLPPSRRTWAREIAPSWAGGHPVLELRDPNDGLGADPATKTRYQYLAARGLLWRRRLPPAPLTATDDQSPWADGPGRWEVATLALDSPLAAWAMACGVSPAALSGAVPSTPRRITDGPF